MAKQKINIPINTIVGQNTAGSFKVINILSKPETDKFWLEQFNKPAPHDQAYQIQFKCGKTYWTLKTQVWKCMSPNDVGWRTCYKCNKTINESCRWNQQASHPISVIPERELNIKTGDVFNDLKAIRFAFNKNRHNYWEFECIHCGATFYKLASDIISGEITGYCLNCGEHESIGERTIREWLELNNISFKREVRFEDCRRYNTLPFDFAIYNKDKSLNCLIEFDGEQHFKYIPYWHGSEEGFQEQQLRDNIKTKYCKDNNIKLIRIPYTKINNINQILSYNLLI